jgi:hypothetical protein
MCAPSWGAFPSEPANKYSPSRRLRPSVVARFGPALDNRRHGAGRSVACQQFVDHF